MTGILLGETLKGAKAELDLQELITGRTLLCSISRWGKTWTARRIVEQIFGKTGIIIVDVEGVLDRRMQENQWVYSATPEFAERVRKTS
jgi:hypothetical protein